jgi:uncharacterized protein (UPF0335 family)
MAEIILLSILILHLVAYNDIKNHIEKLERKEKEKESILRKGLM